MILSSATALGCEDLDLLIVENIGNLVCPAEFDIGEDARAVVLSVTEGDAPCLGDLDGDGQVNTVDILLLLSEFGCLAGCAYDLTGDGLVNVPDLLVMLGSYGFPCP